MNWNEKCLMELTHHHLFENDTHRSRFRDLLNCYYTAPFFTKGLCKCMYLSSWDDEHFAIILDVLNEMTINGDRNLQTMVDQGKMMEHSIPDTEKTIMELSGSFLTNQPYQIPDMGVIDPEGAHIIRQALIASSYIDELPAISKPSHT